ncbi:hypothetical protein HMPREF3201_02442 [Megasphaera sp. MJR8396C]|nr:hypothetical protein HMPREF3201_02442 [Megasphaera sp. MJR8396C]
MPASIYNRPKKGMYTIFIIPIGWRPRGSIFLELCDGMTRRKE